MKTKTFIRMSKPKFGKFLKPILISSSCHNKIAKIEWLKQKQFIFYSLEGRKFKVNVTANSAPQRGPSSWLDDCCLRTVPSHGGDRQRAPVPSPLCTTLSCLLCPHDPI